MPDTPRLRAHIISHTHWDREWYRPFQVFRAKLVDVMDELIEFMEAEPRYAYFHLDGQTIALDDYLEIEPANRERLERLTRSGRILVGPWYVQPDEWLPSGEALVRNLLLGTRDAAKWGEPLRVGYLVDMFGHTGQTPQILRGFGIDSALLFRGLHDDLPAEAEWRSPDGSRVLLLKMPCDVAYSDFFYYVRHPLASEGFTVEKALPLVEDLVRFEEGRSLTRELLFMDGVDHIEILPELPDLIDAWNADPERGALCELVHAAFPEYLDLLRPALEGKDLRTLEGELRLPNQSGRLSQLFYGFHSSRVWIKQRNDACESLLTLQAEPLALAASLAGAKHPAGLLDLAWRYLLRNQPHDSICGCSIDQVHKDMVYRFDQCELIGREVLRRATNALFPPAEPPAPVALTLVNTSGVAVDGLVEVEAAFPHPRPREFRLRNGEGREVPIQLLGERHAAPGMDVKHRAIPHGTCTDFLRLALPAEIGQIGSTTLALEPSDTRVERRGSLSPAPNALDNGVLRIEAAANGTLTLLDHRSGAVTEGLLLFEDTGDVGDGWTYRAPAFDEVITSHGAAADISLAENGPLQASLRIALTLRVPAHAAGNRRSDARADLPIVATVTLRKGEPVVHISVHLENTARDHRVRVLFPSDLETASQWEDGAFDIVERPIRVPDTDGYLEESQEICPQQSFSAVSDGVRGLAVIAPSLKESCVRDDPRRTVAMTLFRSFNATVGTSGEIGAQVLGGHEFRLCLVPFEGAVREAGLPLVAQRMRAPVTCQVTAPQTDGTGATDLVSWTPECLVLSALKRTEDGGAILVRLWNPTDRALDGTLTTAWSLASASLANLAEEPGEALPVTDARTVSFTAGLRRIVSLRLAVG